MTANNTPDTQAAPSRPLISIKQIQGDIASSTWAKTQTQRLEHGWLTLRANPHLSKEALCQMTGISRSSAVRMRRALTLLHARPGYRGLRVDMTWEEIWGAAKDVLGSSLDNLGVARWYRSTTEGR